MSKLLQPALPITITRGSGNAIGRFRYDRKVIQIESIDNRFKIREGWWRQEVFREYLQARTSRFTCLIYRDLIDEHWYLQRIQD